MRKRTLLLFTASFLCFSISVMAARPLNGTTNFTATTPGVFASGNAGNTTGISAFNVAGFNFNLTTVSSPATMNIEVWDGAVSSGNGVAFYDQSSTINPHITAIIISSNDGARFDFGSIGINATNAANGSAVVTITGLNTAGNPVSGATITGVASSIALTTFSAGSNPAFKGVARIKITSSDMNYAFIDDITITNVGTTLPMTLLDFTAEKKSNGVQLNWYTAMEQNTKECTVQHSNNGTLWTALGRVNTAGNSLSVQAYSFVHSTPSPAANYYRLAFKDADGKESFSKIVRLDLSGVSRGLLLYPNPVSNGRLLVNLDKETTVQVVSTGGMIVLQKTVKANGDVLALENLPKGVYRLIAGSETASFLVQ